MAYLVKGGREQHEPECEDEELRLIEGLVGARYETFLENDPPDRCRESRDHEENHGESEEKRERRRNRVGDLRVGNDPLQPKTEERVRLADERLRAVRLLEDTERP
jgi:hypothetical protein